MLLLAAISGPLLPQIKDEKLAVKVLVIASAVQLLALGAMLTHRLLIGGAGRRTVAERWFRHAVELPTLNRFCRGMGPGNKPDMA